MAQVNSIDYYTQKRSTAHMATLYEISPGLLSVEYSADAPNAVTEAKRLLEMVIRTASNQAWSVLLDFGDLPYFPLGENRPLSIHPQRAQCRAIAIVTQQSAFEDLAYTLLAMGRKLKIFTDKEKAVNWLSENM